MSNYQVGLKVGGWFVTPGQIKDEANRLDADIESASTQMLEMLYVPGSWTTLQAGVTEESPLFKWYLQVWKPWKSEWKKFLAERQSWTSNMWGSSWDQIQEYRKKLVQLHDSAKAIGVPFIGPRPQNPPPVPPIIPGLPKLSTGIYIVGGVLGGLLLWKVFSR